MQRRHKSARHVAAANARWRVEKAQAERDAGIEDAPLYDDVRRAFPLPLAHVGYRDLLIEPRLGYVSWRAVDEQTGEVVACAALKELLRLIARQVPRMVAERNFH